MAARGRNHRIHCPARRTTRRRDHLRNSWKQPSEQPIQRSAGFRVYDAAGDSGRGYPVTHAARVVIVGGGIVGAAVAKGYRLWGADIHTEYDVYEAGLGWTAKLDKGDFLGKAATLKRRQAGLTRRLCCITMDHRAATLLGNEPVYVDDKAVGHVTSANFGYSVGCGVAFAYLPIEHSVPGTRVEIEYTGVRYSGVVAEEPLFDPKMERMRAG